MNLYYSRKFSSSASAGIATAASAATSTVSGDECSPAFPTPAPVPRSHMAELSLPAPDSFNALAPARQRAETSDIPRTRGSLPLPPYSLLQNFRIGLPKYVHEYVTMSDLARSSGYTLSMVSRVFSGKRGLSMAAARKFAKRLGMTVDEVIELVNKWARNGNQS